MNIKEAFVPLALFLFPGLLAAQSPFDGTRLAKPEAAQLPKRPEVYSLRDGVYDCGSCVPRVKANADGKDYPIAGSPYFSTVSIHVVDDHSVEIVEKLKDKIVYKKLDHVSADGNTLRQEDADFAAPNSEAVVAEETFQRIGTASADANAVTGTWRAQKIKFNSQNGATVTYHSTAQSLAASNPGGEGYDANREIWLVARQV